MTEVQTGIEYRFVKLPTRNLVMSCDYGPATISELIPPGFGWAAF
jgi:hypothetical protein